MMRSFAAIFVCGNQKNDKKLPPNEIFDPIYDFNRKGFSIMKW